MTMIKKSIAVALGTLMLVACSNEEDVLNSATDRDTAHFSATINAPLSRAYDTSWDKNDKIGITGVSGTARYTNVCYLTAGGDGNFAPENESEKIYFQNNDEVTFTAYWPWNDLKGATAISANTWGQANQKTFDFLWAQAKGSKASNNVAFNFAHKMTKVVFTIKRGVDVSYEEVKAAALSLEGFRYEGTFDVTTGETALAGNAGIMDFAGNADEVYNAPYMADDQAQTVAYTLILFPQEFTEALTFYAELVGQQTFKTSLDFTSANATVDESNAKNEWVAGRQYNIGIVLNKTDLTVEGCTIRKWEEADGGDINAD